MYYHTVTAYLIACRSYFDRQRRAAMAGEPFHEPQPQLRRSWS